jgi:hypothetical protein
MRKVRFIILASATAVVHGKAFNNRTTAKA